MSVVRQAPIVLWHKRSGNGPSVHDAHWAHTLSRLLEIIRLFCKRALEKRLHSAKETYNFKEPTNRSHPIVRVVSAGRVFCSTQCYFRGRGRLFSPTQQCTSRERGETRLTFRVAKTHRMHCLHRSFSAKYPTMSCSFVENDLQFEASYASAPPCNCRDTWVAKLDSNKDRDTSMDSDVTRSHFPVTFFQLVVTCHIFVTSDSESLFCHIFSTFF